MRTIETLGDLHSGRALVRSNFNVPPKDGKVIDDDRIHAALPTLIRLVEAGTKVVVTAHPGRSKGKADPAFSLAPVAKHLDESIDAPVTLAKGIASGPAEATTEALKSGEIALPENVRYNVCEISEVDEERGRFAVAYAEFDDTFVSDGLGVVHRRQASVHDIAELLPSASGLLVLKEVESLHKATDNLERPYGVALGGSKVFNRLGVVTNLLGKADRLLIGGGMTLTFLIAQGCSVGKSLLEEEQIDTVKGYIAEAAKRGVKLILPINVIVAPELAADAPASIVTVDQTLADQMGLDIGPESRKFFAERISSVKTAAWNDSMGVFEFPAFAEGTKAVTKALSEGDIFSVTNDGDSTVAVRLFGFDESTFSHIPIGGGASLELLESKVLPGIAVLED